MTSATATLSHGRSTAPSGARNRLFRYTASVRNTDPTTRSSGMSLSASRRARWSRNCWISTGSRAIGRMSVAGRQWPVAREIRPPATGYRQLRLLPGRALGATGQHLADAGQQNFLPDRLAEKVGRSRFEALRFDLGSRGSGDEDRRRLDPLLDHDLEEAEAVQ